MLRFANALVGPLTGGLAVTGVVSSAMFGTICGSAPATAASDRRHHCTGDARKRI